MNDKPLQYRGDALRNLDRDHKVWLVRERNGAAASLDVQNTQGTW